MAGKIVCVYKTGGDFTLQYIRRLARSVKHHTGMTLACLSDEDRVSNYCDHVPIVNGWPKWWSKLELFQHFDHAVYVDLDTIIKSDISTLLDMQEGNFGMCAAFGASARGNSSVMRWRGDFSYLTDLFTLDRIAEYSKPRTKWGDQDFIWDNLRSPPELIQESHPGLIASRKLSCFKSRQDCGILCYHGRPRPHQTNWSAI